MVKIVTNFLCAICWSVVLALEIAVLSRKRDKQIPNSVALIATLVCLVNAIASIASSFAQG